MTVTDLPLHLDWLSEAPRGAEPLYELNEARGGYTLTNVGRHLQRVRRAMAETPYRPELPRPAKGKEPIFKLRDWQTVLAVASPSERALLLGSLARKELRVDTSKKKG